MWENGYSAGVGVRPQPTTWELRLQVDDRTPITEIRSPLFNNIGEVAVLQYRFGRAPIAPSNVRESGTASMEGRRFFPEFTRATVAAHRRALNHTQVE
jgi:hypothetical protein